MNRTFASALVVGALFALSFGTANAAATVSVQPAGGIVGSHVVARASGLPENVPVQLVWFSARPRWQVRGSEFYGIVATDTQRVVTRARSDARGNAVLSFRVPTDFGYVHDLELHAGDTIVRSGFTVIPHMTISPRSGPQGMPITVTMSGLGYRFYQLVWHVIYDGSQTGWASAITTHGTAHFTLPATGLPGLHVLQAIEGPGQPYLNEAQSPNYQPLIPTILSATFRMTPGAPMLPRAASSAAPRKLLAPLANAAAATLRLSAASATVGTPIVVYGTGFRAGDAIALGWQTVVGNDVSGNGWQTVVRPLTKARVAGDGTFRVTAKIPDDLGGDHAIVATGDAVPPKTLAHVRVAPSVLALQSTAVNPGRLVTVRLRGVGWTAADNIYALVMDNSYVGYACGFNTHGDITMEFLAPGVRGWHFIDLYPSIYRGDIVNPLGRARGATVSGSYFQLPMLNPIDHPGPPMPAFHLAFRVN